MFQLQRYLLHHRHDPEECEWLHGSWTGFAGRLIQGVTVTTCSHADHGICWTLTAESEADALAQLPAPVAARTTAMVVR
jgi:hypothetical protein